eukprot:5987732-Alexandrium_andersonii.AAC.1
MHAWTHGCADARTHGRTDARTHGRTDARIQGRTDACTDALDARTPASSTHAHARACGVPKCARTDLLEGHHLQVLHDLPTRLGQDHEH